MTQEQNPPTAPHVFQAIRNVQAALAKEGISKSRNNQQQGYKFRGIDEIFNALAPHLAEHGLVILPRILSRTVTERTTQKGGVLFYVVVEAEYDFVSADDGSKHAVRVYGEAMDSADKATNKAMSAAYKYACLQTFCIPTEADNDADATTHEVAPQAKPSFASEAALITFTESLKQAFRKAEATAELNQIKATNQTKLDELRTSQHGMDRSAFNALREAFTERLDELKIREAGPAVGQPARPKTVEDAMKPLPASVAADEINY